MELHDLLAKKFVQRRDVKAVQQVDGTYRPDRTPWKRSDFKAHVDKSATFGHYLSDQDSNVKLFVFDVDLEPNGTWVERPDLSTLDPSVVEGPELDAWFEKSTIVHQSTPREDWKNRKHPGRSWYKFQLRTMAEMLSSAIHKELGIQVVCSYSGNKGIHVYGFTGVVPAHEARAGALLALEAAGNSFSATGEFVPVVGKNFYQYNSDDPVDGFRNLKIELFPKQASMDGKDLGNLVRLPLGRNLKNPKDPCFFLDQSAPHNELVPHPDPVALLEGRSPWQ